jgi:exosortase/archaeosortase family protein
MMKISLKNPLFRFLGVMGLFMLAGFVLRELYHYVPAVHNAVVHSAFIDGFYRLLLHPVTVMLNLTGIPNSLRYNTGVVQYFIYLPVTNYSLYLWLPCLGLSLMYIYAALVISFPGTWKRRILYILFGWVAIQVLNVIRLYSTALVLAHDTSGKAYLAKNSWVIIYYDDIFNYVVIFLIFLMFVRFTRQLSKS